MHADREGGFTLIELLVVIIIIGILAAIAIPVYLNQKKKAWEASEKSDLRTTANEMESWIASNDSYVTVPFGSSVGPGPTSTISGSGVTVGGDVMSLSRNNTITLVAAGSNGYCLSAVNSNIGNSVTTWYYDSLGGGITKTACTPTSRAY
jgi:prepilin-type N-terminal cleavage/methylation domain-containing protein